LATSGDGCKSTDSSPLSSRTRAAQIMREKPHLIITTGTSQGICAALTRALLKPGNRLICVSRSRNPDAETTPAASGRLGTGLLLGRIRADAVLFVFFVAGAA